MISATACGPDRPVPGGHDASPEPPGRSGKLRGHWWAGMGTMWFSLAIPDTPESRPTGATLAPCSVSSQAGTGTNSPLTNSRRIEKMKRRRDHPEPERGDPRAASHCPRCRVEYRPGFESCSDCNIPLVPGPAQPERPPWDRRSERGQPHFEIVTLWSLPWKHAWLLAGRLREEGIRADVPDYEATFREWEQTLFPSACRERSGRAGSTNRAKVLERRGALDPA